MIVFISENRYIDIALEKINKLGGFNNLSDIDKLALLGSSNNENELKKLSLKQIYKENGKSFGRFMIRIKVKSLNEQPITHRFSQQQAGKYGWLYPYIDYNENNKPYVNVRFEEFNDDTEVQGGGNYTELPIMLDNMFPVEYSDIKSEFTEYDKLIKKDKENFLNQLGLSI